MPRVFVSAGKCLPTRHFRASCRISWIVLHDPFRTLNPRLTRRITPATISAAHHRNRDIRDLK
jgi:hypothetical protein